MKRPPSSESGFIPLLVTILIIVAAVVYLAYTRVLHAHQ